MDKDFDMDKIVDTLIILAELIREIGDSKCMISHEDIEMDFDIKLEEDDANELCNRIFERENVDSVIINEYGFNIYLSNK